MLKIQIIVEEMQKGLLSEEITPLSYLRFS